MSSPAFREPTSAERFFNRAFGLFVSLGIGPSYVYLLEVRGRKTGKLYSTPVDLLELNGKRYLVAPRGRTQWVRNAETAGEISLRRGSTSKKYRLRVIAGPEKLNILNAYLESFKGAVQRYFSIPAGSPADAFAAVSENHPAFELLTD